MLLVALTLKYAIWWCLYLQYCNDLSVEYTVFLHNSEVMKHIDTLMSLHVSNSDIDLNELFYILVRTSPA